MKKNIKIKVVDLEIIQLFSRQLFYLNLFSASNNQFTLCLS
jgi:hypothetical protein